MNIPSAKIPVFDYTTLFDLPNYRLKLDLSPSIINDATGVTVDVEITKPSGDKIASTPFSGTALHSTYEMLLPTLGGVIMWGYYRMAATVKVDGVALGKIERKFNLCAPDNKDRNTGEAKLYLTADCQRGKIKLTGMTGYSYKGQEASQEESSISFFYPGEAEKPPIKNIKFLPLEIDGYTGPNTAKGSNISTYIFDDNISVRVNFIATASKNVRCGYDMEKIYCALQAKYLQVSPEEMCDLVCQLAIPLQLISIGLPLGRDVDEYIDIVEKALGADCGCCITAGERMVSTIVNICTPVSNLRALLVNNVLSVMFDSTKLNSGDSLIVRYRNAGISGSSWTEVPQAILPTYNANQSLTFTVTDPTIQYEVSVVVTCCDGEKSADVKVKTPMASGATCPVISGAVVEGYQSTSTAVKVEYGWSSINPHDTLPPANTVYKSKIISSGDPVSLDFTLMADFMYPIIRVPHGEPVYNHYADSGSIFNADDIPGNSFRAPFLSDGFDYYTTYEPISFSKTPGSTVTFSIQ